MLIDLAHRCTSHQLHLTPEYIKNVRISFGAQLELPHGLQWDVAASAGLTGHRLTVILAAGTQRRCQVAARAQHTKIEASSRARQSHMLHAEWGAVPWHSKLRPHQRAALCTRRRRADHGADAPRSLLKATGPHTHTHTCAGTGAHAPPSRLCGARWCSPCPSMPQHARGPFPFPLPPWLNCIYLG